VPLIVDLSNDNFGPKIARDDVFAIDFAPVRCNADAWIRGRISRKTVIKCRSIVDLCVSIYGRVEKSPPIKSCANADGLIAAILQRPRPAVDACEEHLQADRRIGWT
jgi:hypothetical protein